MQVLLSKDSNSKTFHRAGCFYATRIDPKNKMIVNLKYAKRHKYHPCKYCSGLQGFTRINYKELSRKKKAGTLECTYSKTNDTMYLRTQAGFWKIYKKEAAGYLLYHLNVFNKELKTKEMMNGYYHRQTDVPATGCIEQLVSYVEAHDRAKQIIAIDYRNLPHSTKKQKQYYMAAKRKDRRQKMARLDQLLDMLEKTGNCRASDLCG